MLLQHPPSLREVTLRRSSHVRVWFLSALVTIFYAISGYYVYTTLGEPHAAALAKAALQRAEAAKEASIVIDGVGEEAEDMAWAEEFWDEDESWDVMDDKKRVVSSPTAAKEAAASAPSQWVPNVWAGAALTLVLCSHILFHLLCRWLVWFKAAALTVPATKVEAGCILHITPSSNRGKGALVPLRWMCKAQRLVAEFQRQHFEYISQEELEEWKAQGDVDDTDMLVGEGKHGGIRLIEFPMGLPVQSYMMSNGLNSEDVAIKEEEYGPNILSVHTPSAFDLWVEQLLSPLVVFQLFCAGLWMLDEYWQYTLFTLFSVVSLEFTTAFQRLRTLKTLHGMCSKPHHLQVFREGAWSSLRSDTLFPGDLVSLRPASKEATGKSSDLIPCDMLLLKGSAVVNEAALTGESVPQMKDAIRRGSSPQRRLDIQADRVHVLLSGTSVLSVAPGRLPGDSDFEEDEDTEQLPETPDGGALCYVLRTGFSSSQGSLVQMIEFSTHQVAGNDKETLWALIILLIFALVAAGYVMKKGMEKGQLSTYELLLKSVIIITSVVPTHFPIQMAVAVNQALMALNKVGVFCTEPFRVPFAGKITHTFFDKTGTITTDQLSPAGIVNPDVKTNGKDGAPMVSFVQATPYAAMVLAACHSLVEAEGQGLVGDPIEVAALHGVGWEYDAKTRTASPGGDIHRYMKEQDAIREKQAKRERQTPADDIPFVGGGSMKETKALEDKRLETLSKLIREAKSRLAATKMEHVRIRHRHHFSSRLQRMSVVCELTERRAGVHLVKGSPESIKTLLIPDTIPKWFDVTYGRMAQRGMRVLAMGYKVVDMDSPHTREDVECVLHFAGFVAFECKIRGDSGTVMRALSESAHAISMLTGDAPLTALHVARSVSICPGNPALLLCVCDDGASVEWRSALSAVGLKGMDEELVVPFSSPGVQELASKYDLVSTEAALQVGAEVSNGKLWEEVGWIPVLARMSPAGKAKIVEEVQRLPDNSVFMCGDGGNDIGGLKQADVGLALLSGHGDTNTVEEIKEPTEQQGGGEEVLNRQSKALEARTKASAARIKKLLAEKTAELKKKMMAEWLDQEMARRRARGEPTGGMAYFGAVKAVTLRMQKELKAERVRLQRLYGNVFDAESKSPTSWLDAAGESTGVPVVRPGDASIAAPFTSKAPSIRAVVDLIRQGRCTMLGSLQQQQIMMLESVISAYTLAVLSLEGARSSERQLMATSWLMMIASIAFSYAKPIQKMSPIRPIKSLFHPSVILSTAGQAIIHIYCLVQAVSLSTETMGQDKLDEVLEFHKKSRAKELDEQLDDEWDFWSMWSQPFLPNLLNTVVFLVQTMQIISILFVNYRGRPWMKGMMENHALLLSVFLCAGGVAACAWEVSPMINGLIHLVPFPEDVFRWRVLGLVGLSLVGTFLWDRLCTAFLAKPIWGAMWQEAKSTSWKDFQPILKTVGLVAVVGLMLATGNTLLLLGGVWLWRRRKANQAREEQARLQETSVADIQ